MPVLRLGSYAYSSADQGCTAAISGVAVGDDVGDMQSNVTNVTVAAPGGFDETGETPSLSPGMD